MSSARFWKWRARSNKSTSEQEVRDISYASPMSSLSAEKEKQLQLQQAPSPYLSESAHVLSLQRPVQASTARRTSRAPRLTPTSASTPPKIAEATVDVNVETEHAPSEKHDASAWHRLFHHAKLRLTKHKSASTQLEESF